MSLTGYIAVERFGPEKGDAWRKYLAWSGLHHLKQVITTDGCLCPHALKELSPEDWKHNIQRDLMIDYFRDLAYLLDRVENMSNLNVLGSVHQPSGFFPHGFIDSRFEFAGYDLVDKGMSISALLNCGGFPESFSNSELNESGLLTTFERAKKVQSDLFINNPEETHADCDIQALWLYRENK